MRKNSGGFVYVLITCLVFLNVFVYSKIITNHIPEANYEKAESGAGNAVETDDGGGRANTLDENHKYINAADADVKSGNLILVNASYPYDFDASPSVSPKEDPVSVYYNKTDSYFVKDINVSLNPTTITAFNGLMDAFYEKVGKKCVIITQGHRTYDEQKEMLDLKVAQYGEDQKIAQKPGFSEHHTGYALDISTYENQIMGTFTGEDDYAFVHENAHKYGFILRYPEEKEDVTGISYEPWHLRYVGIPHSIYIYENGITLEEYIKLLSLYPFESGHLKIQDKDTGEEYEVYSVKSEGKATPVPVPKDENAVYSVSGDNAGNIIVTIKK
ncbi:MAG: M15 family metallopeptidase [Clostridiales bacterium]|nr:M15 family metallopeptidase [Clostridiales bacterium]